MASEERPIVVKVGGSLFDLPELGRRVSAYFEQFGWRQVFIVPGGGPAADAVRLFDRVQQIGEEAAHWCALRAMSLNTHLLQALLPSKSLTSGLPRHVLAPVVKPAVHIVDAFDFFAYRRDAAELGLPHSWDVTSDSIAATVAKVFWARKLILLKSVTIPPGMSWAEASERGYVDKYFPTALAKAGDLEVEAVNFRQWQPPT